jgi:hypothetical protein
MALGFKDIRPNLQIALKSLISGPFPSNDAPTWDEWGHIKTTGPRAVIANV